MLFCQDVPSAPAGRREIKAYNAGHSAVCGEPAVHDAAGQRNHFTFFGAMLGFFAWLVSPLISTERMVVLPLYACYPMKTARPQQKDSAV